jgi:hypothetical protein
LTLSVGCSLVRFSSVGWCWCWCWWAGLGWQPPWCSPPLCACDLSVRADFKDGRHPHLPTLRASYQALIRHCSSRTQSQTRPLQDTASASKSTQRTRDSLVQASLATCPPTEAKPQSQIQEPGFEKKRNPSSRHDMTEQSQ